MESPNNKMYFEQWRNLRRSNFSSILSIYRSCALEVRHNVSHTNRPLKQSMTTESSSSASMKALTHGSSVLWSLVKWLVLCFEERLLAMTFNI